MHRFLLGALIAAALLAPAPALAQSWQELPPNDPTSLPSLASGVALVYDQGRDTFWVHCGTPGVPVTTYRIDPSTGVWTPAVWDPNAAPLGEPGESAFDEARGKLVVVPAGSTDVYEWDLATTTWSRHTPSGATPGERRFHALAYDAALGQIVLFGGLASPGDQPMGDIWGWDGTSWTELTPATGPGPRWDVALVGDTNRKVVRLVGGGGDSLQPGGLFPGDTWTWDGASRKWVWLPHAGSIPKGSTAPIAGYDPSRSRVVFFGSQELGCDELDATGKWSTGSFSPFSSFFPNGGAGALAFDSTRRRMVLVAWTRQSTIHVWALGGPPPGNPAAGAGGNSTSGTATPGDDQFEPNDTLAQAASIGPGRYVDLACREDDWFRISLGAGDTLTVTESSNGLGLTLHAADGSVVARSSLIHDPSSPGSSYGRTASFRASVADDYYARVYIPKHGSASTYTLTVNVPSGNHPPVIAAIADATAYVGQPLSFRVAAQDPDGDPVTLAAQGLPASASFDPASGTLELTPAPSDVGTYAVSIGASDASSTTTATFVLTVAPAPALPAWRAQLPLGPLHLRAHVVVPIEEGSTSYSATYAEQQPLDLVVDGTNPGALTISGKGLRHRSATASVADDGTFALSWDLSLTRQGAIAQAGVDPVYTVMTETIHGRIDGGDLVVTDYAWSSTVNDAYGTSDWTRSTAEGRAGLR